MLVVDDLSHVYEPPTGLLRLIVKTASAEPVTALRGVSLTVGRGEVVGLIGPNGAGKSTLIRSITGLLEPMGGTVSIDGRPVRFDDVSVRSSYGLVLPDDRAHYWRLTGRQNLEFFGVFGGLSRAVARDRAEALLVHHGLAHRDKRVFGYSAGMRARLGIARAMMHDPTLLVLDEPTRSLDPIAAAEVGTELGRLADAGKAVLLSSHRLDEVSRFCDRVVAVVEGEKRFEGRVGDLVQDGGDARLLELLQSSD